ncbi:hypothetical protein [Ulvibacter antarcticus]|uniref:Uncharacterized protein n=1 Tax=Ulvibacter antarcticus TaxID=442714 RepID=A0A3L9YBZ3_9FLAO|nr:hypothetical protein [Ulvibacter antarcticus]RMA57894.1 hypothetical protein BXY75_2701 [Ulvibacter antarcticus]
MYLKRSFIIFILLQISMVSLYGQHIGLHKKSLKVLASEEKINVIFAYDELTFDGRYISEKDFLKITTSRISNRENSLVANQWKADYLKAKKIIWPEAFITELNTALGQYRNAPAFVLNDPTTKYTMVIHTYWMDFGWDIGLMKRPAKATMTIYFYLSSDPENFIASTKLKKREGLVADSRYGNNLGSIPSLESMQHVYERIAPDLAKALKRIVKK